NPTIGGRESATPGLGLTSGETHGMNTTSISLLERLRNQLDPDANWKRFVRLYTPLLYFWANKLGLSEADAADLVQEVFALLVQKLPGFDYDRGGTFRGWLRAVLVNKWREQHRRRTVQAYAASDSELAGVADSGAADPLEEAEYRQHLVARALRIMQAE